MSRTRTSDPERETAPPDPKLVQEFEVLLAYLKQSRGFDFTAYKRSSLMRRVTVRMQTVGMNGFANYQDFLQVDPDEFTHLFNTILINVTAFFRDPAAWEFLKENVVPTLVARSDSTNRVRVWSAGCASGQEAYSIAMLLVDQLGGERFRERVKIYATDVDEDALNQARLASYSEDDVADVPPTMLKQYFDRVDSRYVFNKDLRRSVIFGRHDLIQDAPISRVDLLICRNCLMYFNAEAQARILARFHFSLVDEGVVFLGKAETLLTHAGAFQAVDVKRRLFAKAPKAGGQAPQGADAARALPVMDANHWRLREAAADTSPVAHMVLDPQGNVVQLSQHLRGLFGLSLRDVGRPFHDLEVSYRPFELRSCLERAYAERRPVSLSQMPWSSPGGQVLNLELLVVPLPDGNNGFLGAVVYLPDATRQHRLQEEIQRSQQELETALEELQSTNEELETTNEELQSTVEELETTNEELQSTNEELETMNEELQSTNEELQAINEESSERSDELGELNVFLEGVLTSLHSAVAVVDREFRVSKWSRRAEDLWGLRAEEVTGANFLNLDSGLPVDQLRAPIRTCLSLESEFSEIIVDAMNRRGKAVRVRITCTPLRGPNQEGPGGVILLMDEIDPKS